MWEKPPSVLVELVGEDCSWPTFEAVYTVPDSTLSSLIRALAYLIAGVILSGVTPSYCFVTDVVFLWVARAL